MKKLIIAIGASLLLQGVVHAETPAATTATPAEPKATDVGYAFGLSFGQRMKESMSDIDIDSFIEGLRDVYGDKTPRLTPEQINQTMQAYQMAQQMKQREAFEKMASENRDKGQAFLTDNGKQADVITTASGLQYKVLNRGKGESPALTDTVEVHYTGRLISGEVFDSSVERGEPVTFPVNGVIKGWVEALQLMKPGDKWQLYIPSDLAYGPAGTPNGRIGPNETLLFDVELLSVKKN